MQARNPLHFSACRASRCDAGKTLPPGSEESSKPSPHFGREGPRTLGLKHSRTTNMAETVLRVHFSSKDPDATRSLF